MRVSWQGAEAHLAASDPTMAALVRRVGPCEVRVQRDRFRALAESILYQQLAGAAAATICARVRGLNGGTFPRPAELLALPAGALRSAGVSPQKERYLRALAAAVERRGLDFRALARAPDEEVVEALTALPGIGDWTAHMFLIFSLGRPDVLPTGDYGVRKGMQRLYRLRELPKPARMEGLAAAWKPYRTAASWYLWRSLDAREPGIR